MSRRRDARGPEPLGAVLATTDARRSRAQPPPVDLRVWEASVGTRIAARARPVRLDRGTLHVVAASSTWCQELALLSETIVAGLVARGVAVQALRFRVGPVTSLDRDGQAKRLPRPQGDAHRRAPPEAPLPPSVERALTRVPDEELRAAIATAAAKNLGWQAVMAPNREGHGPPSQHVNASVSRAEAPVISKPRASRGPRDAAPRTDREDCAPGPPSSRRHTRA